MQQASPVNLFDEIDTAVFAALKTGSYIDYGVPRVKFYQEIGHIFFSSD